eukprot:14604621-Alexandrium_andersonii.AAC.1
MSASLVGSEMCIRDSLSRCQCHAPSTRRGRFASHWRLPSAAAHAGPCACLLYTSDAADDM